MGSDHAGERSASGLTGVSASQFLQTVPQPVVVADRDRNRILDVNNAAEALLERSQQALIDRHLLDLHPSSRREAYRRALAGSTRVKRLADGSRTAVETPAGEEIPVTVTTESIDLEDRTVLCRYFDPVSTTEQRPADSRRAVLFEKTQEMATVGAWEYTVQTDDIWWSSYVREIFGRDIDTETTVTEIFDHYQSADREAIETAFERALEAGESYDLESKIETAAGETRWVRTKGEPQSRDGEIVRVRGTIRDITERKERERELERHRERLQVLFDEAPNVIIVHDTDGQILDVNDKHADNLGYTREELLSMDVSEFEVGADPDALARLWASMEVGAHRRVSGRHRRKDGSTFPAEIWLNKIEIHGEEQILAVSRDVTERVTREQELRRFRRAIEAAGQAIFLTERDGTITYVNPAFEEITGYSPTEAIGETPSILNSGQMSQRYFQEQWSTILAGKEWSEYITNRHKSGTIYHAHQTIAPITDDAGTVQEFVAIQTDVTDRKKQEQQLDRLDRVFRHDLRNELNVIDGHAELLTAQSDDRVVNQARRILESTENLLETAKKGRKITELLSNSPQQTPIDAVEVLKQAVTTVHEGDRKPKFTVDTPDRALVVATDQIHDAIVELLENAIRHADDSAPTIEISLSVVEDRVRIRIADDGPGIPEIERESLDETGAIDELSHGSGLGLWFVKLVVSRSHGTLEFETRESGGTIVTIELEQALSGDS
ncbi:PAS domain S-box protein [Salinadaptatus halalkaliphilus]|uniref:histidine kinase n=1 Tax=Salinadaptatus halalkaliphilus TaxID=2419781 RepID=A0A4S3TQ92_9EURY|nr:PAS domain S-box protein [Salinadaptatus halalkaliphilus]THE66554.1 PAS domain S-box protein [Salinadaptatus halalkaliphilus]